MVQFCAAEGRRGHQRQPAFPRGLPAQGDAGWVLLVRQIWVLEYQPGRAPQRPCCLPRAVWGLRLGVSSWEGWLPGARAKGAVGEGGPHTDSLLAGGALPFDNSTSQPGRLNGPELLPTAGSHRR